MEYLISSVIWFAAVGCGIMAGVYFTFSTFVMTSLAKIDTPAGIAAMQSINDVILKSLFMPLFFGTTLVSLGAIALGVLDPGRPDAALLTIAGAVYVVGMFLCTAFFNVPLNNRLKAVDPASPAGAEIWDLYLQRWTRFNHIRTLACVLSTILFIIAL